MGYLRKNNTIANPAKKSLTVFQNSYQETYQTGTTTITPSLNVTQTGMSSFTIKNNTGYTVSWEATDHQHHSLGPYATGYGYSSRPATINPVTVPTYGTRTVWNTRWSKRSA